MRVVSGVAAAPAVQNSCRLVYGPAMKKVAPDAVTNAVGSDEGAPGARSPNEYVPVGVPSVNHGSTPASPPAAKTTPCPSGADRRERVPALGSSGATNRVPASETSDRKRPELLPLDAKKRTAEFPRRMSCDGADPVGPGSTSRFPATPGATDQSSRSPAASSAEQNSRPATDKSSAGALEVGPAAMSARSTVPAADPSLVQSSCPTPAAVATK